MTPRTLLIVAAWLCMTCARVPTPASAEKSTGWVANQSSRKLTNSELDLEDVQAARARLQVIDQIPVDDLIPSNYA